MLLGSPISYDSSSNQFGLGLYVNRMGSQLTFSTVLILAETGSNHYCIDLDQSDPALQIN